MRILALETTGRYGSAAVITGGDDRFVLSCRSSHSEMNHLLDIISLIDGALTDAGLGIEEIDAVAASIGPGSFTGIRIGVSTARALSQSLGIKCIPVRTLRALAERDALNLRTKRVAAGLSLGIQPFEFAPHYICTAINARRDQIYAALWYLDGDGILTEILSQKQYMIENLLEMIAANITNNGGAKLVFYGDGVDAYEDKIKGFLDGNPGIDYRFASEESRYQCADAVANVALSYIESGKDTIRYADLLPDYMRKTEAEMRLEEGTLSRKCTETMTMTEEKGKI